MADTEQDVDRGVSAYEARSGGLRKRKRRRSRVKERVEDVHIDWHPVTDIGILVRHGIIRSLEEIYVLSLPVKEHQIIDFLLGDKLKDEVLRIIPIRDKEHNDVTGFKVIVVIGDSNGHVGVGVRKGKRVTSAVYAAFIAAKLSVVPVRRGYWGNKVGSPHTVPCKVMGNCLSKRVRLMPAPRGTGIISTPATKKILQMAGIKDCFTSTSGSSGSLYTIVRATYAAIANTYYVDFNPDSQNKQEVEHSPRQKPAESHKDSAISVKSKDV